MCACGVRWKRFSTLLEEALLDARRGCRAAGGFSRASRSGFWKYSPRPRSTKKRKYATATMAHAIKMTQPSASCVTSRSSATISSWKTTAPRASASAARQKDAKKPRRVELGWFPTFANA